jgi:ubiquinone/menaquinone biosynthesis C-methylase UbiE
MTISISDVKAFWNENPCNSRLSTKNDRKQYFEEITYKRYNGRDWHVPTVAKFEHFRGKDVLEIGCSIATDGLEFAKQGARYVGVDLTPEAIEMAKERFELFNLKGHFHRANAEDRLPFPDNSFDHIYSFGVIHHSPNTEAIVDEMYRVLRPGGTLTVMLYNRASINYRIEILVLRRIGRWFLYPEFMPKLLASTFGFDEWKLRGHRETLFRRKRLSKAEWISMNTDGPHCPLAKVYGRNEASKLFSRFSDVRQEIWEFNSDHWSLLGKLLPRKIERGIGRIWGWHRMVYAVKRAGR